MKRSHVLLLVGLAGLLALAACSLNPQPLPPDSESSRGETSSSSGASGLPTEPKGDADASSADAGRDAALSPDSGSDGGTDAGHD